MLSAGIPGLSSKHPQADQTTSFLYLSLQRVKAANNKSSSSPPSPPSSMQPGGGSVGKPRFLQGFYWKSCCGRWEGVAMATAMAHEQVSRWHTIADQIHQKHQDGKLPSLGKRQCSMSKQRGGLGKPRRLGSGYGD